MVHTKVQARMNPGFKYNFGSSLDIMLKLNILMELIKCVSADPFIKY